MKCDSDLFWADGDEMIACYSFIRGLQAVIKGTSVCLDGKEKPEKDQMIKRSNIISYGCLALVRY